MSTSLWELIGILKMTVASLIPFVYKMLHFTKAAVFHGIHPGFLLSIETGDLILPTQDLSINTLSHARFSLCQNPPTAGSAH